MTIPDAEGEAVRVSFMMRFELGLEEPEPSRAWQSATTIAVAYIIGGVTPLSAYLIMNDAGGCSGFRHRTVSAERPGRFPAVWLMSGNRPLLGQIRIIFRD